MYAIAEQVSAWLAAGRDVTVAQIVSTQGFSSRDHTAALARSDGDEVGSLGLPVPVPGEPGRHELAVSDAAAATVGLSCGGRATVLVRPAREFPAQTWDLLAAREPVCLVSDLDGGATELFTQRTVREAVRRDDGVPFLFGRGTSTTTVRDECIVVSLWPVPELVVVGDGMIADALATIAGVLGWRAEVTADPDVAAAAVGRMHRCDAVVVLSHDREVDGPVLTAALDSAAGYIGALGSQRTQAARRAWLAEHGITDVARVHGPAGLDIDAHTPGEIAVSILAEALASRADATAAPLRDRPGPVHQVGTATG
ncbi:XdhC family protein [Jatrophihabitans fulvus]